MSINVEMKQNNGVSQVLKQVCTRNFSISIIFTNWNMGSNFAVLLYVMEMTKGDAFAISMISVRSLLQFSSFPLLVERLPIGGSRRRQ